MRNLWRMLRGPRGPDWQELARQYGEPRKIYDLSDYFSATHIDFLSEAYDSARGEPLSIHINKIVKRLKKTHRIDEFSHMYWVSDGTHPIRAWSPDDESDPDVLESDEEALKVLTQHGEIWRAYVSAPDWHRRFVAWAEVDQKYLQENWEKMEAEAGIGLGVYDVGPSHDYRRVAVQFTDGSSATFKSAEYEIKDGIVIVKEAGNPYPTELPAQNVKSISKS